VSRNPWREYVLARRVQLRVGEWFGQHGLKWERATRSRGPASICAWNTRLTLLALVRSGRRKQCMYKDVPRNELNDLIAAADRIEAKPVIVLVWLDRAVFHNASTGKVLANVSLQPQQKRYLDTEPNERRWWWVSRRYARGLWQRAQFKTERSTEYTDA